jgi:hypothetical protein
MIYAIIEVAKKLFPQLGNPLFVIGLYQAIENGSLPVTHFFF